MDGTKKISIADIYIQSLQKESAFLKEKLVDKDTIIDNYKKETIEGNRKHQEELIALREDLSRMVKEIASLNAEKANLQDSINIYDRDYVPVNGSHKIKDEMSILRKQLREAASKNETLIDAYDVAKEQFNSACAEANALRKEKDSIMAELERSKHANQLSLKELEGNREDMAKLMKEVGQLKAAIAEESTETFPNGTSSSTALVDSSQGNQLEESQLVSVLRQQIVELSALADKNKVSYRSYSTIRGAISIKGYSEVQGKLDLLTQQAGALLLSCSQSENAKVASLVSSIAEFRNSLNEICGFLDSLTNENNELRKKNLSIYRASNGVDSEQKMNELVARLEATEKTLNEKLLCIEDMKKERAAYESSNNDIIRELKSELSILQKQTYAESDFQALQTQVEKKDKLIEELRSSIMSLEKEIDRSKSIESESALHGLIPDLPENLDTLIFNQVKQNEQVSNNSRDVADRLNETLHLADVDPNSIVFRSASKYASALNRSTNSNEAVSTKLMDSTNRSSYGSTTSKNNPTVPPVTVRRSEKSSRRNSMDGNYGNATTMQTFRGNRNSLSSNDSSEGMKVTTMSTIRNSTLRKSSASRNGSISDSYESYESDGINHSTYEGETVDDAIAQVLHQMIENPQDFNLDTIDDISFPNCGLTDSHLFLFSKFISMNSFPSLQSIDVSHNHITTAAAIPFIEVLLNKGIPSLAVLDLSYNEVDDTFAKSLLSLLISTTKKSSIKSILVEGNPLSSDVMIQMKTIFGPKV